MPIIVYITSVTPAIAATIAHSLDEISCSANAPVNTAAVTSNKRLSSTNKLMCSDLRSNTASRRCAPGTFSFASSSTWAREIMATAVSTAFNTPADNSAATAPTPITKDSI